MSIPHKILTFSQQSPPVTTQINLSVRYVEASIDQVSEAVEACDLVVGNSVLVIIGGASQIGDVDFERIRGLFQNVLAPVAEVVGATVIDGGTDVGIMRLMGEARSAIKGTFPLLGVAPASLVLLPGSLAVSEEAISLEPHHTCFIGVPGTRWGDESAILAKLATEISGPNVSVVVLINGGAITLVDAKYNVQEGRELWVIGGTGRNADRLVLATQSVGSDAQLTALVNTGRVRCYDLAASETLKADLLKYLSGS